MAELGPNQFDEFFETLWDKPPFAWQKALAERVLAFNSPHPSPLPAGEGMIVSPPWPEVIALPTASGKTACLDIAVFALAVATVNTPTGQPLPVARRIFFVVDRRVIVDEAFERARKLAKALREAESGILKTVADALRQLGGSEQPLACYQLRGGMYRSDAWAQSPAQPAIVTSTVDQLGSRLLFRAYGRSFKAWPIQAGLAGNDTLIFLDEAHCAQPFLQTLQTVRKYRAWPETPLTTPFHAVVMSATPPTGPTTIFRDESAERRTPRHPLGDRQLAAKPAALEIAKKAKGANALEELAAALARQAVDLVAGKPLLACVIFVNRVATARAVLPRLEKLTKGEAETVLLTGRMRPFDKDDTVKEQLKPLSSVHSADRVLKKPVFVVATQTLEVGADLDFDALVTECASLDALRQRFGRLNRMGREIDGRDDEGRPLGAGAVVLVRADQADKSDDDPVYGAALANTWKWLNEKATAGEIDFGIAALEPKLPADEETLGKLNAPALNAPVMLPAHVDCWVQTAPEPMPTPEPALFLHGPGKASADVLVCWRADLDLRLGGEEQSIEVLTLCPPATAECVSVPIGVMRRWLAAENEPDNSSDVEGTEIGATDEPRKFEPRKLPDVIRWRGRDDVEIYSPRAGLRPGDVIVIPAHHDDWKPLADLVIREHERPIFDLGDRAYVSIRAKALLRLHPKVLADWPSERSTIERLKELANAAQSRFEDDTEALLTELRDALRELEADSTLRGPWRWLRHVAHGLLKEKSFKHCVELHPFGGLILRGKKLLPPLKPGDYAEESKDSDETVEAADRFSDEDDASSSSSTKPIALDSHLKGVADFAQRFAAACRLPPPIAEAVTLAGLLHDLGKADPRFQSLLRAGNPAPRNELLAKSGEMPQGRAVHRRALNDSGYPQGGRHELLSVRLAESAPALLPDDSDLRDLVLHLIASHHGHCRPFAPVAFDEKPMPVAWAPARLGKFIDLRFGSSSDHGLERLDSGVAERFWRLTRRYGWWGLAWLEAILRLADHRRSEAEAEGKTNEDESQ
jgi:CRISPR-associated endonuclease/helicase Cas3